MATSLQKKIRVRVARCVDCIADLRDTEAGTGERDALERCLHLMRIAQAGIDAAYDGHAGHSVAGLPVSFVASGPSDALADVPVDGGLLISGITVAKNDVLARAVEAAARVLGRQCEPGREMEFINEAAAYTEPSDALAPAGSDDGNATADGGHPDDAPAGHPLHDGSF